MTLDLFQGRHQQVAGLRDADRDPEARVQGQESERAHVPRRRRALHQRHQGAGSLPAAGIRLVQTHNSF